MLQFRGRQFFTTEMQCYRYEGEEVLPLRCNVIVRQRSLTQTKKGRPPSGVALLIYICASRYYCNSAVFKVIFDAISFIPASSDYVCTQKRGYGIECRLLLVEIRNTSFFMELRILVEMD